ncbi:response regulator [Hymenobacter sp. B81]|uniref:response regulator n=1 Tax=Hymenobacter sp. B81 TaxID=3344878 RepID=UPI0037DDA946
MNKLACILLVDDDPTTNYLHQLLLRRLDVADQLLVALNGQEALDVLQTQAPTASAENPVLVLLDVKMPVLDGFGFLEAYAQLPPERQQAVVVMLTTSLHPQDMARMRQSLIAGFFNKPLTRDKVGDILLRYFDRQLPATDPVG